MSIICICFTLQAQNGCGLAGQKVHELMLFARSIRYNIHSIFSIQSEN